MRASRILAGAAATAFLLLAAAQPATAQRGRGFARYDVHTVQTLSGQITAVDSIPSPRGLGGGLHVQLKAADKSYDVHLGPRTFLEGKSLTLAVGDAMSVTGSVVTFNDAPAMLAASITKGTVTVALRDSTGIPLWAARRGPPRR